jgi:hypothetical protein
MGITMDNIDGLIASKLNAAMASMKPAENPTAMPTAKVDDVTPPAGDVPPQNGPRINPLEKAIRDHDMDAFAKGCGNDKNKMEAQRDTLLKSALSEMGISSGAVLQRLSA